MGGVVDAIGDVVGGAADVVGDVVGGVADIAGDVVETVVVGSTRSIQSTFIAKWTANIAVASSITRAEMRRGITAKATSTEVSRLSRRAEANMISRLEGVSLVRRETYPTR